jgi:hypothetical protein
MLGALDDLWPTITALSAVALLVVVLAFVVLRVRDERAAIAWVGIILLSPVVGAIAYLLVGINRIKRRARSLRPEPAGDDQGERAQTAADAALADAPEHIVELAADGWSKRRWCPATP